MFAQSRALNAPDAIPHSFQVSADDSRAVVDTIFPAFIDMPCAANGFFVYTDGDGNGAVFGNNGYGDKEKSQMIKLPANGSGTFSAAIVFWAYKTQGDDNAVTLKVYDIDAGTCGPGTLLGTGSSVNISSIDTAFSAGGGFNIFTMSTPVSFTNGVHVSIDVTALTGGDTAVILATEEGCGIDLSSWELWSDDTWHDIPTAWGFSGPVEMMMAAVVDWTVSGIDDQVTRNGLTLRPATPNPAISETILNFDLAQSSDVEIKLIDINGKMVKEIEAGNMAPGSHQHQLDVRNLAAGSYYYIVSANGTMLASTINVVK